MPAPRTTHDLLTHIRHDLRVLAAGLDRRLTDAAPAGVDVRAWALAHPPRESDEAWWSRQVAREWVEDPSWAPRVARAALAAAGFDGAWPVVVPPRARDASLARPVQLTR
ncbi:MAG: hypothetical protein NW201_02235 [Gemmatimonadales bacterium]|nr:hypothetical protein [Gemmatimonadales bacterium]